MPVNVSFPGHEKQMRILFNLRRINRKLTKSLNHGNTEPVRGLVIGVTSDIGHVWEQTSPRLTGTGASATREKIEGLLGRVFIAPNVVNPVFGGKPVVYMPIVHRRQPWVANLVRRNVPGIITKRSKRFINELDRMYESAK